MDARTKAYFEDVSEGMEIPTASYGPMDRHSYIPIAFILRDANPLHLDRVYAHERDLPDVVQQGPLNETFLYRFLTDWLHNPWDIRRTKVRFSGNAFPDDMLTCKGSITRTYRSENGEPRVDCQIWQENQKGEKILSGEATFTLPERGWGIIRSSSSVFVDKEKKQLRTLLRKQRRGLSLADVHEKSRLIFERLQTFPLFQNATTIVTYAADENEVQTEAIWQAAIKQNKTLYYPRITPARTNLDFIRRYPTDQLIPGTFGILIPPGNDILESRQGRGTVVLTPGVGFDTDGRRLGRGKGYYDRAFGGALAGAVRVALAYELQIVPAIPSGPQDECVDWIVTERRLIDCAPK